MSMSTFQKATLATCLVLCVALLLPKMLLSRGGKKDAGPDGGPGRFPPMANRQKAPAGQGAVGSRSRAHNPEAIARAKGAGTGVGTGGKSNLAGQIIPIYGFGILAYILYILFKITNRGSTTPTEKKFPSVRAENKKRKITDFELVQLQEKLRETELVMENIVSKANHSPERVKGVTSDQEESLLMQLREITRVMQEGRLMEGMAPESKPQAQWEEDFPEEPHQHYEHSHCPHHHDQHDHPQTQTETDAERTEGDGADGADLRENHPEDPDSEEAEKSEDSQKEDSREAALATAGEEKVTGEEEDTGPEEGGPDCRNKEEPCEPEEVGQDGGVEGDIDLGVPKEDLVGVLEELELTLKMTSVMELEKMEDLSSMTSVMEQEKMEDLSSMTSVMEQEKMEDLSSMTSVMEQEKMEDLSSMTSVMEQEKMEDLNSMTSVMEQEKMEDLSSSQLQMPDGDTATSCTQVRRRNRRRNKKRDCH